MGAFDEGDILTIHNPKWDEHEQARARVTVRVSDEEWVQNQLILIKQNQKKQKSRGGLFRQQSADVAIESQVGAAKRLWVFRMLKDWTFTKNNMAMPLTIEAVKQLRQDYLDYIYEQIMAAQPKDEDEETEQGDDEDDTDPTLPDVLPSIVGETSSHEKEPVKISGKRNFLPK